MKPRKLGKLEVSELGAGCMSISANYGPPADKNRASQSFAPPTKRRHLLRYGRSVWPLYKRRALLESQQQPGRLRLAFQTDAPFVINRPS